VLVRRPGTTAIALLVAVTTGALALSSSAGAAHGRQCESMKSTGGGHVAIFTAGAAARAFNQGQTGWAYFIVALGKTSCGAAQSVLALALGSGDAYGWLTTHNFTVTFTVYHDLKVNGKGVPYAIVTARVGRTAFRFGTIPPPPAPPPPVLGASFDAVPVSGAVTVEAPGSKVFAPLRFGQRIPVGSTVDTRYGTVTLTAAEGRGRKATGTFYAGLFTVGQEPAGRRELTVLTLVGPSCTAGARDARGPGKHHKRGRVRSLWGNAHGGFSTVGKYASATERGTKWLTSDTCRGTLIRVVRGEVAVRDFPHHRSFLLRAGRSFLAHPGRGG
jgi:hypothetical protein